MQPVNYTNKFVPDNLNFDDPPPRTKKKIASPKTKELSKSVLKSGNHNNPPDIRNIIDITHDVKQTAKKIRSENNSLMPKKISEKKLSHIVTAATLSIVAGIILGAAGVVALASGPGTPVGLSLIGIGIGLFAAGCGTLKFYSKEINTLDKVEKNKQKIESLKYLKKGVLAHDEQMFIRFLKDLKNNLSIGLSIPDFFVKYPDTLNLYKLYVLKEEEKEIRRYDNFNRRAYPATTDYSLELIRFINTIIEEHIKEGSDEDDLESLYDARIQVVEELPIIHESMSIDSILKINLIEKESERIFVRKN